MNGGRVKAGERVAYCAMQHPDYPTTPTGGSMITRLLAASALFVLAGAAQSAPRYEVDAAWPKALPNNWLVGQVAGVAVDEKDHIWIVHRPRTLSDDEKGATFNPPRLACCVPAPMEVDPASNEVFVADGYKNRRVIVFDGDTGAYKRHWGAYGARPDDTPLPAYKAGQPPAKQFATPVHCARLSKDGHLYVCDR